MKSIREWSKEIHELAVEKGWWESKRNMGELLMLVVTEIAEAMEAYRDGAVYPYLKEGKPEGMAIELADAVIRILDFCHEFDIDLETAMEAKHEYNKTRSYRHGGKAA